MIKLLALAVVLTTSCCTIQQIETSERTAYTLEFAQGHCSGTAISENVILTAAHCFETDEAISFKVNGRQTKVTKIARDGNDHILVMVDISFATKAELSSKAAKVGDKVFYYGNPGIKHQYRTGYVTGFHDKAMLLDVNSWRGDSGAAIFNERGEIVGVVSAMAVNDMFKLTIAYPLAFTRAQYERFGL